ncbi:MAG: hypothetical protein ACREAZ_03780 [Nitrososphaera sp.]
MSQLGWRFHVRQDITRQALQGDVTFEQVGEFLGEHTADEEMEIEV